MKEADLVAMVQHWSADLSTQIRVEFTDNEPGDATVDSSLRTWRQGYATLRIDRRLLTANRAVVEGVIAHEVGHVATPPWTFFSSVALGGALLIGGIGSVAAVLFGSWPLFGMFGGWLVFCALATLPLVAWAQRREEYSADSWAAKVAQRPYRIGHEAELRNLGLGDRSPTPGGLWQRLHRSHPLPAQRHERAKKPLK